MECPHAQDGGDCHLLSGPLRSSLTSTSSAALTSPIARSNEAAHAGLQCFWSGMLNLRTSFPRVSPLPHMDLLHGNKSSSFVCFILSFR